MMRLWRVEDVVIAIQDTGTDREVTHCITDRVRETRIIPFPSLPFHSLDVK
jgi:hypothetical protein